VTGEEKAAVVERAMEPFNRGDIEAMIEFLHPEAVLYDLDLLPDSGEYRGFDGMRTWRRQIEEQFETFTLETLRWEEAGDLLIADSVAVARGKSGAEVDLRFTVVWGFRDGKIVLHKGFGEREDALAYARAAE
jgi:ketosteroid isomerase-like protein